MPGLFATLQSMGMTGALGPAILGVGIVAVVVVGGYLLWRWYREDGDEEDGEDEEGEEGEDDDDDDDDDEYDCDKEVEDDDKDHDYDIEEEDDIEEDVEDGYYNDDTIDQEEDFYATRLNGEDRDDRKWSKVGGRKTLKSSRHVKYSKSDERPDEVGGSEDDTASSGSFALLNRACRI